MIKSSLSTVFISKYEQETNLLLISMQGKPTSKDCRHGESLNEGRKGGASAPFCQIVTWVKLHQAERGSREITRNVDLSRVTVTSGSGMCKSITEQDCWKVSPNVVLDRKKPGYLSFHHYKKFNSYDLQFHSIIEPQTLNLTVSEDIDLFEQLIDNRRDICFMGIGGLSSGLHQLCEEAKGREGIFYLLVSKLADRLEALKQKSKREITGYEHIKQTSLKLKFLVVCDDKLYDLANPKNNVILRQNRGRTVVTGCDVFEPSGVYDIYTKMKEISAHRRLVYPESTFIIQGELFYESLSTSSDEESLLNHNYFSLIEWQKSLNRSKQNRRNHNNNKSLLTLNMCIYELYKFSLHDSASVTESQTNKLWANFRNSDITKFLKNYLIRSRKLIFLGCISVEQDQEEDSYQTLMLCKNISKINFQNINFQHSRVNKSKYRSVTVPVEIHPPPNEERNHSKGKDSQQPTPKKEDTVIVSKNGENFINLEKVKNQLKKILDTKREEGEKQKQKNLLHLAKMGNKKKKDLIRLRYKEQEIKVREEYCNFSRVKEKQKEESLALPNIDKRSKQSGQYSSAGEKAFSQLHKDEQQKKTELNKIHEKLLFNLKTSSMDVSRSVLQLQIKENEGQILDYIDHKRKIIGLLKDEVKEIKKQQSSSLHQTKKRPYVYPKHNRYKNRIKTEAVLVRDPSQELQPQLRYYNPEDEQTVQNEAVSQMKPFDSGHLKNISRGNYMFEKRRAELKRKIMKNKQEINHYYEQAANNFQNYSRDKPKYRP